MCWQINVFCKFYKRVHFKMILAVMVTTTITLMTNVAFFSVSGCDDDDTDGNDSDEDDDDDGNVDW